MTVLVFGDSESFNVASMPLSLKILAVNELWTIGHLSGIVLATLDSNVFGVCTASSIKVTKMKSEILAIIPARAGSKRLPRKNKKSLGSTHTS